MFQQILTYCLVAAAVFFLIKMMLPSKKGTCHDDCACGPEKRKDTKK
jgi:large-conductance mechanosensitive channel